MNGGVYSVQTYVKFPIGQRPSKLPYSFEELEEMYQASDQDAQVEVGFKAMGNQRRNKV